MTRRHYDSAWTPGRIATLSLALLLVGHALAAQRAVARFAPPPTNIEEVRAAPPPSTRARYMIGGGFLGLLVGATYAGAQLGNGTPGARDRVFILPLAGLAIGAGTGALVYELGHARRSAIAP